MQSSLSEYVSLCVALQSLSRSWHAPPARTGPLTWSARPLLNLSHRTGTRPFVGQVVPLFSQPIDDNSCGCRPKTRKSDTMTRVPTTDCRTEAGAYFALGMVVLPHRPGTKQPWVRWKGYHTGDWLLDHAQVNQYWDGRFGDPGIMLVLGPASGLFAVDIDSEAAYQALISRLGEMTTTATV